MSRRVARITRNFTRNLDAINTFLAEQEAPGAFATLLDQLFATVIPNLTRFPDLGRDFLASQPHSTEGLVRVQALRKRLGDHTELREYITGDYLVLYARRGQTIYLLSIKHHRQLSFDLRGHW